MGRLNWWKANKLNKGMLSVRDEADYLARDFSQRWLQRAEARAAQSRRRQKAANAPKGRRRPRQHSGSGNAW